MDAQTMTLLQPQQTCSQARYYHPCEDTPRTSSLQSSGWTQCLTLMRTPATRCSRQGHTGCPTCCRASSFGTPPITPHSTYTQQHQPCKQTLPKHTYANKPPCSQDSRAATAHQVNRMHCLRGTVSGHQARTASAIVVDALHSPFRQLLPTQDCTT